MRKFSLIFLSMVLNGCTATAATTAQPAPVHHATPYALVKPDITAKPLVTPTAKATVTQTAIKATPSDKPTPIKSNTPTASPTKTTAKPEPSPTHTITPKPSPKPSSVKTNKVTPTPTKTSSPTPSNNAGVWDTIAECESSGDWTLVDPHFYGGLQFTISSWHAVGGTGMPNEASKNEQIMRAEKLQQLQGWGAWPVCSKKAGLR